MGLEELRFDGLSVLVTGGAGFIGSNLCDALVLRGARVRCLDDFSTGKRSNLASVSSSSSFELIEGDVKSLDDCLSACEGVDFVLHEAAWGSVPRSLKEPLYYSANNIQGTLNMLEASRRGGVRRFVYASSSAVYGDAPELPKREGREGDVLSPYALTKRCDEEWAKQYSRHFGLQTVGLRYFNVFGRRQDPNGPYAAVIPRFVKATLDGERPTIYGDGSQSRDFTYVENVVQANLKACFARDDAVGETFNIACGDSATLLDLCQAIADALGVEPNPIFAPERPGDVKRSLADVSKARRMLGYEPEYDFRRGLAEAIDWYKANLSRLEEN